MLACAMESCTKAHSIIKKVVQDIVGHKGSKSFEHLFDANPSWFATSLELQSSLSSGGITFCYAQYWLISWNHAPKHIQLL